MDGRNEGLVGGRLPGAGGAQQVYSASESSLGGGASSLTAAAREEASGREEGDAHQDGSNDLNTRTVVMEGSNEGLVGGGMPRCKNKKRELARLNKLSILEGKFNRKESLLKIHKKTHNIV